MLHKDLHKFHTLLIQKNPSFNLEIIGQTKDTLKVYIRTKYGICKVFKGNLLRGQSIDRRSAINPTSYFINQAKEVHEDKFNYSKVKYEKAKTKVCIICPIHGEFWQEPNHHLIGNGCSKCSFKVSNLEQFIFEASKIHNNFYKYDFTKYNGQNKKVIITCPLHGNFQQVPNSHLSKGGCRKCRNEKLIIINSENPLGWNKTNWFDAACKSKEYNSFKTYIIRCWNEEEEFYKIGRTFLKIKRRFLSKRRMPYNYEIIQLFEFKELTKENCIKSYDLETELKRKNKENKYLPLLKFNGRYECFKKLI